MIIVVVVMMTADLVKLSDKQINNYLMLNRNNLLTHECRSNKKCSAMGQNKHKMIKVVNCRC